MKLHVGFNPGPILYDEFGTQIADCRSASNTHDENKANANKIAHAANVLPEVVCALDDMFSSGHYSESVDSRIGKSGYEQTVDVRMTVENLNRLRAALARAEEVQLAMHDRRMESAIAKAEGS